MKPIKVTPSIEKQMREDMLAKLNEQLSKGRNSVNSTINLSYKLNEAPAPEEIVVNFTPEAYLKQLSLISRCTSEVAWHGIVEANEDRTYFTIKDIMVYPQKVTGVTVETDEVAYQEWKMSLIDEQYNNLRFQAHSHVNMGVTPSGQDHTTNDNILQSLSDDSYYIIMIANKKEEMYCEVYDLQKNALYTKDDIIICVDHEEVGLWAQDEIDQMLETSKPTSPNLYNRGATYFDHQSYLYGYDNDPEDKLGKPPKGTPKAAPINPKTTHRGRGSRK